MEDNSFVSFKDVAWLQSFPLNKDTALDYFSLSQFYERTCNNEVVKMQARFASALNQPDGSSTLHSMLSKLVGVEYVLADAKPTMFIIHKRFRHGPDHVGLLGVYYILDGTIYQSPRLVDVIESRMAASMCYLHRAISKAQDYLSVDDRSWDPEIPTVLRYQFERPMAKSIHKTNSLDPLLSKLAAETTERLLYDII